MDISLLFFELIRVSLGKQKCLTHSPSADEWGKLYNIAKKQSLLGVCFVGVKNLQDELRTCPEDLYLSWLGKSVQIQQRNELLNRQCTELQQRLYSSGFRSSILKGQGVAGFYGESLGSLRQSGDIDIWVDGDRDKVLEWFRGNGAEVSNIDSVHAHVNFFEGTELEVHSRPSWMYSSKGDKAFTTFWEGCKNEQFVHMDSKTGIYCPTADFNLVYSMLHINRHIFEEGIGLRQLMDYYFILMASSEVERQHAMEVLLTMNLKRFTCGIMYIEQKVFGLEREKTLWNSDMDEGEFLLHDILAGGNFGKHDSKTEIFRLEERWKRGWFSIRHNMRYLVHYPSEVLSIPTWKLKHYCWRKRRGYIK